MEVAVAVAVGVGVGSTPTWLGVDQATAELPPLVSGTGAPARRVTYRGDIGEIHGDRGETQGRCMEM